MASPSRPDPNPPAEDVLLRGRASPRPASALLEGLRLLTRLPGRGPRGIESISRVPWLFVPLGILIGLLWGMVLLGGTLALGPLAGAALGLLALYGLTGVLHFDGLTDLGDALAAPPERRLDALRDHALGAGGLLLGGSALLLLIPALMSAAGGTRPLLLRLGVLVAAEAHAKAAMTVLIGLGRPMAEGMARPFLLSRRPHHAPLAIGLAAVSALLWLGPPGLALTAVSLGVALALLALAHRGLGGVNGDVLGASNELTRLAVLLSAGPLGLL
ncbi:MAG: adenosylcobinamide-GDP ribazoletransferase [Euryarchaeota archaeon]|nr:adenosylcobinamide-GDP ribazoletransferase [Euryarchaeota archaeon]